MRRTAIQIWQDRIRDPSLTVLLVLELCLVFLAAPLAARGVAIARPIGETLVLAVLVIVVMLIAKTGRDRGDPSGLGSHLGEPCILDGMVTDGSEHASPRR